MEAEEERGKAVNEERLDGNLVSMPDAVEEALPELLKLFLGKVALGGKPGLEKDSEGLGSGGLVAGRQLLDERHAVV